jgi:HKD family nuclease
MKSITGLGIIENAGPNHLGSFLKNRLKTATGVDIGVAFITRGAILDLLPYLKRAAMNGRVRVVTGLYHCFTEPEALRQLLFAQRETDYRISIRISTNRRFHWKSYFLFRQSTVVAIIGSSNLTDDGLSASGELNAVISAVRNSEVFRTAHKPFVEEWGQARPLTTSAQIALYAKARGKFVRPLPPPVSLNDILGTRRTVRPEKGAQQHWRDWISGTATAKTERLISEATNWDSKGYLWYVSGEPRHSRGDRIILFDFDDNYVRIVRVMDRTTMRRTPDGRHFTAYKQIPGTHRRKISKSLFLRLANSGLVCRKAEAQSARKVSARVWEKYAQALA